MKFLKLYENFNSNLLYHYTNIENAISILNGGYLKPRGMSQMNKYSSSMTDDYGYVSFTGNDEYHYEPTEIPSEVRFVFNVADLDVNYELTSHDANVQSTEIFASELDIDVEDLDDLDFANNIDYYGDEDEYRIYNEEIPIKYIQEVGMEDGIENKEIEELCKKLNLSYEISAFG